MSDLILPILACTPLTLIIIYLILNDALFSGVFCTLLLLVALLLVFWSFQWGFFKLMGVL